jgi:hypothetical protein
VRGDRESGERLVTIDRVVARAELFKEIGHLNGDI